MADPFADKRFIEKLRISNVFAPQGGLNPGTPFGMPNLSAGLINTAGYRDDLLNENERERQHELEMARMNQRPALQQIAKSVVEKKPMNVVYQPNMTEYQRGTLAGRSLDRQSRENIAGGRLDLGREQIEGRYGLQDLRGNQMQEQIDQRGNILDSQINRRGDITSRQIGERGDITSGQIDQRGRISSQQIQDRGRIQEGIQQTRGTQGLEGIAARARGAQQLQDTRDQTFTPSETRGAQNNAVRQLMNTNPELGSLVTIGTGGSIEISPEATPEERALITSKVFITRPPGDISLRPETPRYNNATVEKPKARKYRSVSVE